MLRWQAPGPGTVLSLARLKKSHWCLLPQAILCTEHLTSAFLNGAGEAVFEGLKALGARCLPVQQSCLQLTCLHTAGSAHSTLGVSADDVGDSFPNLIRNCPQAPNHSEAWEEGKYIVKRSFKCHLSLAFSPHISSAYVSSLIHPERCSWVDTLQAAKSEDQSSEVWRSAVFISPTKSRDRQRETVLSNTYLLASPRLLSAAWQWCQGCSVFTLSLS